MKTTISISVILLLAFAVYGFIDYRQQQQQGKLDQLYKDEKYNPTQQTITSENTEEKLNASLVENTGETREHAVSSKKEVNAKAFSRAAFESVVDEPSVEDINHQTKRDITAIKAGTKTREEQFRATAQDDTSVVEVMDITIEPAATPTGDTLQDVKNEKELVRLSEFSRAPIRKNEKKRIAKKH